MAHHIGSTLKPLVRLGRSPADCWEWLGAIDSDGHARKEHAGRSITAARWIWLMFFGPIPEGLVITTAPTCGNKACGNPFHLRCCHQADANRAAVHVTLLPSDVIEIKRARKDKTPCTAGILAERYGCSKVTIHEIWGGRTWRAKKAPNYGPQRAIA
jgi:hypothetical protein